MSSSGKRSSNVWQHYAPVFFGSGKVQDKTKGKCKYCNKTYATGGGTTALRNHIESSHPDILLSDSSSEADENMSNPNPPGSQRPPSQPEEVYCICRQPHAGRFMICCDRCNEWFHGDCINLPVEKSELVVEFYCEKCEQADPACRTQYKPARVKKTSATKPPQAKDTPSGAGRGRPRGSTKRKQTFVPEDDDCEITVYDASGGESSSSQRRQENKPLESFSFTKAAPPRPLAMPSGDEACHSCVRCYKEADCGVCSACKEMKKFGGPGRLTQKCLERICVYQRKQEIFRTLVTPPLSANNDVLAAEVIMDHAYQGKNKKAKPKEPPSPVKVKSVKREPNAEAKKKSQTKPKEPKLPKIPKAKKEKPAKTKGVPRDGAGKKSSQAGLVGDSVEEHLISEDRQCYGLGCVNSARVGSKYCSDECGRRLARSRIDEILKPRVIQLHAEPSQAALDSEARQKELLELNALHRRRLADYDAEENDLHQWVAIAHELRSASLDDSFEETSEESDQSMFCVTCGHEISMKVAIRHITKCVAKWESQSTYGSTNLPEGEFAYLFCNELNKATKMFCKRLRNICPEHSRDPKVDEWEICGFPLNEDQSLKDRRASLMCQTPKKRCLKHYQWDRIRAALIDMQRVGELFRLEKLMEEATLLKAADLNRVSVISLLMHETRRATIAEQTAVAPPPGPVPSSPPDWAKARGINKSVPRTALRNC